ncbi:MAG: citramalate synthase [Planctomycetes bacterium]|nr:citramalate synthase [Planctomycetota bacterium]
MKIFLYDTTLRDGCQAEGISFSLEDKLAIALKLDDLGIHYVEGGYPHSNPKDQAFFREIRKQPLRHAKIAAFGSTRKAGSSADADPGLRSLLTAETAVVTIVGKTWDLHVKDVLRTTLDENLKMISGTVSFLKKKGREVVYDAEHFFDSFRSNPDYALKALLAAQDAGADTIVLCDTNGGSLPNQVAEAVQAVKGKIKTVLGIHTHNDSDLATANSVIAVLHGARHVQGTINGFGERCGNADLCAVIPNLALKAGFPCLDKDSLKKLTEVSRYVYEVANVLPRDNHPFVGLSAFAHKGGLHVDAMQKNPLSYEHITPETVGNERRILVSELSGRSTILAKIEQYDLTHDRETMRKIINRVQELENQGYHFEAAEGSFQLVVKKILGHHRTFFDLEGFRVIVEKREDGSPITEATLKIKVEGEEELTASEGDGPVHALDGALRKALERFYPSLRDMRLVDYKVRVINPKASTAAKVRVIIESRDRTDIWGTVGVSENLIEASWQALVDSIEYKLLKDLEKQPGAKRET